MLDCGADRVKIEHQDGLLLADIRITFRGHSIIVPRLVIDTGAECSLISPDAVATLNILPEDTDEIVTTYGIGGPQYSLRKQVGSVQFDNFTLTGVSLDFGHVDYGDINGLIGLDILVAGQFLIDLQNLEIYSKA